MSDMINMSTRYLKNKITRNAGFIMAMLMLALPLIFTGTSYASVTSCPDLPVRIAGPTPTYYFTLQDAYNAASNGSGGNLGDVVKAPG